MSSPAVPGTPIHHVAAATKRYVGCPSIVVLPSGSYIASHSYFGHGATNTDSFVYRSDDKGATWRRIAEIHKQSRGTYGGRRVHAALRAEGRAVSRQRVERLMRALGLQGVHRRRPRGMTRAARNAQPVRTGSGVAWRPVGPTACGWPRSSA